VLACPASPHPPSTASVSNTQVLPDSEASPAAAATRSVNCRPFRDDLNLVGRDAESKLVDTLLGRLGDGGGALLFRGEPGIGKSAVLDRARQRARALGARIPSTVGVESEAELAFASLPQLLHPIVGLMDRLSDPQRAALDAAFGVTVDLEDAERLSRTSHSALEFYNAMLERYPSRLNPTALWFWGARALFPAA
jgi:hypothetical protein